MEIKSAAMEQTEFEHRDVSALKAFFGLWSLQRKEDNRHFFNHTLHFENFWTVPFNEVHRSEKVSWNKLAIRKHMRWGA